MQRVDLQLIQLTWASTLATATAIIAKIISVLNGLASITSTANKPVNLTNLAYVQGDLTLTNTTPTLPAAASYGANVYFNRIEGVLNFSGHIITGNVTLDPTSVASITTLNFTGNTISGSITNTPL